ncbi:protein ALTERED PHOSPHATE STARVATION RESPONSE 1-like [Phragmites australis]|uniref:protein ALTERED PHOSPHATE STARVATION RESPONSE 1-like n=1 Tax=Phragmites australis TaxID=29695 RepID=UPI002D76D308|nr:protein ALTERED PHOSPHATE STARVATION RESPONSE 1-like [Phragmites australis]
MGCGQSKMEEEDAVRHCRERSELLALAIRHRYTLADAHRAYAESMRSVGAVLHDFLRDVQSLPSPPPEPALRLPQQRKGDGLPAASPPPAPAIAPSSSASGQPPPPVAKQVRIAPDVEHIRFHSDDDSDSEDGHIKFHSDDDPEPAQHRPEVIRSAGAGAPPPPQMGPPYAPGYDPPYVPGPGPGYGYGAGTGPGPDYGGGGGGGGGYDPGYGGTGVNGGAYEPGYGGMGGGGYGQSYGGMGGGGGSGSYEPGYGGMGGYGQSFFNISYARSQPPPPSVSHEHRLQATDARVHYYSGEGRVQPPPRGYGGYPYPPQSSSSYNQYAYGGYYGGGGAPPPAGMPSSSREEAAPPSPPSPPRVSTWDFLNPFETYESYYEQPTAAAAPYTPSRSLKDVREEEGIPDLEDEDMEVVKEAYGDEKRPVKGYTGNGKAAKEECRSSTGDELPRESKSSEASSSGSSLEHDVHVVEKSVVGEQVQRSEPRQHAHGLPPTGSEKTYIDDTEVVLEIRTQFERVSDSAGEVSKMLEVGKMPYYQKSSGFKVSAMMICGIPTMEEEFLRFEEDKAMGCGNLSSTLQKLYMWEKKLLEEVKTEEQMRVLYDMKRKELKMLDEKGAEADKLEATEIYIRKLSTKISIAIQLVNTISDKISKLRDEELWPQTCELIQGLMRMWSVMLECHQIQLHAISQAKNIDSMIDAAKFRDTHMELIKRLELQLLDWIACFAAWVNAQKSYVITLNKWLMKGVIYVPEETDDGAPPFSPGRLGAPPIFIICNNWAAGVARISEKEVVEAMQAFASNVLDLWERHRSEQRQGMMANKGMDRDLRVMERDEQSMRKALEAQNKKLVLISNQSGVSLSTQVLQEGGPGAEISSLQTSLKNIFEAMENFTVASVNTYKDLHLRAEEEKARVAQECGGVS